MNPFKAVTFAQAIDFIAETYRDADALVFQGQRFSFRDVRAQTLTASMRLASLGLADGDKIAIWMPNRPEFLWYMLAAARMGLVAVILNTRLRQEEVAYQIAQSNSKALVLPGRGAFRDFLSEVAAICPAIVHREPGCLDCAGLPDLRHVIVCDPVGEEWRGVHDWSRPSVAAAAPSDVADPTRPAVIAFSSGTTSLPKGVLLTHCLWRKGYDAGVRLGLRPTDRLYTCVPLFGMAGLLAGGPLCAWTHGAAVVLDERFDPATCLEAMQNENCTVLQMMPPMLDALAAHPKLQQTDRSRWRVAMVLTADPEVLRAAVLKLGFASVVCGYGLTETSALVTRTSVTDTLDDQVGSNGLPLDDCRIRVVNPETCEDVSPGNEGEIWVSGYCITPGYYRQPEATANSITPDGWLRTGDLGILQTDGKLRFLRRLKDGYKHKGFNVSIPEVEAVALRCPGVSAISIVSLPDRKAGEIGVAFVIPRDPSAFSAGSLLEFLAERLASYKVPSHAFPVERFPLTAGTDKVQKYKLQELARNLIGNAQKAAMGSAHATDTAHG